ncbi:m7GpppX diphosphatase-like [Watersipora subatra]|uniref:m7GpppX diphosphatase-like n=1 Tax=Watersipora subatra TaxID=2589382 RepID=UPI00355BA9E5
MSTLEAPPDNCKRPADGAGDGDVKKAKLDEDAHSSHPKWTSLNSFKFVKVLREDPQAKSVCIHATSQLKRAADQSDGDAQSAEADAIILLEKTAFDTTDSGISTLLAPDTSLQQHFNNDIYGTYDSLLAPSLNNVKTVIIFPASAKHMEKYASHESHVIYESPEDYQSITLPYIQSSSFEMQWIYNILEKKKESEFIVYEDPDPEKGFVLVPDLKWDRKSLDTLYLSAIVHKHGIKSLRDLTPEHLPLLKNILNTGLEAIEKEYGVPKSKLRAYFHYQPSYYHLHVHFNQVKFTAPGSNVVGAHNLSDVIDNIKLYPDYYQKRTIPFLCKTNAKLYKCYEAAGKI